MELLGRVFKDFSESILGGVIAFKIKTRLWLATAVIMLPMFALNLYFICDALTKHFTRELAFSEEYASILSSITGNYMHSVWELQQEAGQEVLREDFCPEEIPSYLRGIMDRVDSCMMELITLDGIVVASTWQREGTKADYLWFYKVLAQSRFVSGLYPCPVTGQKMFYVTSVIADGEGLPAAVIASGVYVRDFEALFPMGTKDNRFFGVVNGEGYIVFRSGYPGIAQRWIKVSSSSPVWAVLETNEPFSGRYYSFVNHTPALGVAKPIAQSGWVAYASSDWENVRGVALNHLLESTFVLMLTVLISFFFAYYLSREVVHKAEKMQQFARHVAAGSYTQRINCQGNDELTAASQALDLMAERIEELEKVRTLFIQAAAHELRNPMTSVKGLVTLMAMKAEEKAEDNQLLKVLAREVDRLASLQNQIIEAFRAQRASSATLPMNTVKVDLGTLTQEVVKTAQLTDSDHTYQVKAEPEVWVMADPHRLGDVLRNLLSNAAKYSPSKTIISLLVARESAHALLAVADRGIGVPAEQREAIFESFSRGSNLLGKDPGGMGLGLFICKDIVERHGGTITISENIGGGSVFAVRLPLAPQGQK